MKLIINGAEQVFSNVTTLSSLVEQLGMKPDRVAIELNRDIVPRNRWNETTLSDGDRLEIVQFVGGGRDCLSPQRTQRNTEENSFFTTKDTKDHEGEV